MAGEDRQGKKIREVDDVAAQLGALRKQVGEGTGGRTGAMRLGEGGGRRTTWPRNSAP